MKEASAPAGGPDPAFVRVKLACIPRDLFLITLGGFAEKTPPGKRRGWSAEDSALLRKLWVQRLHHTELVRQMRRSQSTIYRYAWLMMLPRRRQVYRR